MNPTRTVSTLASCAGLALVQALLPARLPAFNVSGFTLDVPQRTLSVFNNFSDPTANDNQTPDPNWPGALGAPLAIWKAASEWSSELHGDGSGDPTQPGDLGSGGANFDVQWLGLATSVGNSTSNTVSQISGCSGGIIDFIEVGAGGWRVRFSECFAFDDGPGAPARGTIDLQSIFTHEYGHCLGLDHSASSNATMSPGIAPGTTGARSIEADDQAAIQFLYGVKSSTKPHIDAINRVGANDVRIVGQHFAASGNSVVFLGGVVSGVTSSAGGTLIQVALPAMVLAGDVQVRSAPVPSGAQVSNAYPFDPAGCGAVATYCVAKANTVGCPTVIAFQGAASASDPTPFLITTSDMINQHVGMLLYALAPANTPFAGGTLCLGGTLKRTPLQSSGGNVGPNDCSGAFSFDFNARIQGGFDPALIAGQSVYAQYIYRDPPDPTGTGLTDAVAFTICP